MNLDEIKDYLNTKRDEISPSITDDLANLKRKAIENQNEEEANEIWCFERIAEIQSTYLDVFVHLKSKRYFDAWRLLERIDIELCGLRDNFNYSGDLYNIMNIERMIKEYEKLFPYQYFFSRESIVKRVKCSICNQVNTIRNHCPHEVGKLYMGEMCCNIVEDIEFLGMAIVKNPFDKFTVLFPQDLEYNYFMLDNLMPQLDSPYDRFYVEIIKQKNPKFQNIERNDKCPCGSNKKYKNCCKDTENECFDHHKIILLDKPNAKETPIICGNTWKGKLDSD